MIRSRLREVFATVRLTRRPAANYARVTRRTTRSARPGSRTPRTTRSTCPRVRRSPSCAFSSRTKLRSPRRTSRARAAGATRRRRLRLRKTRRPPRFRRRGDGPSGTAFSHRMCHRPSARLPTAFAWARRARAASSASGRGLVVDVLDARAASATCRHPNASRCGRVRGSAGVEETTRRPHAASPRRRRVFRISGIRRAERAASAWRARRARRAARAGAARDSGAQARRRRDRRPAAELVLFGFRAKRITRRRVRAHARRPVVSDF